MGNRYQHLEGAYGEAQEIMTALGIIHAYGGDIPETVKRLADRLGGLIYGLVRAEDRARGEGQ